MTDRHLQTGSRGELYARTYLERKGMRCVDRNWRCAAGEIDLVMLEGDVLVFVEVKTRRTASAGSAEEAISQAKAQRLLNAGAWYVSEHAEFETTVWRIDMLAITVTADDRVTRISHVVDAVASG